MSLEEGLTEIDGCYGVKLVESGEFAEKYFIPSKMEHEQVDGKMGGFTCTRALLLIPKENFKRFIALFMEYAKRLNPSVEKLTKDYNMFTKKEEKTTYVSIDDGVLD